MDPRFYTPPFSCYFEANTYIFYATLSFGTHLEATTFLYCCPLVSNDIVSFACLILSFPCNLSFSSYFEALHYHCVLKHMEPHFHIIVLCLTFKSKFPILLSKRIRWTPILMLFCLLLDIFKKIDLHF